MTGWTAIDLAHDRRTQALVLARARDSVRAGGPAPPSIRNVVRRSWARCREAGVFADGPRMPVTLDEHECMTRWQGSDLAVASKILRETLRDVEDETQLLLIVTDAEGVMLWLDGSDEAIAAGLAAGAHLGAVWSEEAIGTNAMGTALAEGHAVQIFAGEHLNAAGDSWICSAAPVHAPDTGERLGVVNLAGPMSTAHPHSLALAGAAARAAEEHLRGLASQRDHRLRERWAAQVGQGRALGLVSSGGIVLVSSQAELAGFHLGIPAEGATVCLGRYTATVEAVPGGFLLWREGPDTPSGRRPATEAYLEVLGRDRARLHGLGEQPVVLSRRHSEILLLLLLHPHGLSDEQLALELYGEDGKPVTARAEISRLRRTLGPHITGAPYRLTGPLTADFVEIERLVEDDLLSLALARYPGSVLPRSEVPGVTEVRERLDYLIRSRLLACGDPVLLAQWIQTPDGQHDVAACRALVALLDPEDIRRPAALSRVRRLTGGAPTPATSGDSG